MHPVTTLRTRSPHQARIRAVVKTLLYRTFMVAITVTVAWFVTGSAVTAVNIGIATNILKTATYYCYERFWDHIAWGVPAESGGDPTETR